MKKNRMAKRWNFWEVGERMNSTFKQTYNIQNDSKLYWYNKYYKK